MRSFVFGLIALVTWSCSEDEVMVDLRDQAIGFYTYEMEVFEILPVGLMHMSQSDLTGNFELMKGTDDIAIEGKEGELTTFRGDNVQKVSNGFTFNVKDQTGTANGQEVILKGYNGIPHEGKNYQGRYLSTDKSISINFTFTVNGQNFLLKITSTKT